MTVKAQVRTRDEELQHNVELLADYLTRAYECMREIGRLSEDEAFKQRVQNEMHSLRCYARRVGRMA